MDTTTLLWTLAAILVAAGLAGLVMPALPGIGLIFAGLVTAAWAEGFAYVGWKTLIVLGILTLITIGVDLVAGALGAKKFGAGKQAVIGAAIGGFAGIFFGLPGIIFGPFLGALIGELLARRNWNEAGFAAVGTWLGVLVGAALKIAIAFTMIGIFILVRFLR
ncbi:MAG: DUF456 domain-containing protein [Chlorobiaceae bacterium]|nr:DUF456 domain-containing protein [Chlorobiaceae bacterium]NTV61852.1 DUF456 domain-containing protein [Chlorobiaceae bacterium]